MAQQQMLHHDVYVCNRQNMTVAERGKPQGKSTCCGAVDHTCEREHALQLQHPLAHLGWLAAALRHQILGLMALCTRPQLPSAFSLQHMTAATGLA